MSVVYVASGVVGAFERLLSGALASAQVVVDVATSPSFEDQAVLAPFETSDRERPGVLQPNAAYSRIGRHVP